MMSKLRRGDEILGFNHATGKDEFTKVRAWLHRTTDATTTMTKLHTELGDVIASPMHNFAVSAPHMYAFAQDIVSSSVLVARDGIAATVQNTSEEVGIGAYAP